MTINVCESTVPESEVGYECCWLNLVDWQLTDDTSYAYTRRHYYSLQTSNAKAQKVQVRSQSNEVNQYRRRK